MKKLAFALVLIPFLAFAQVEDVPIGKIELGNNAKNFFIKDGEGYKLNQYKDVFANQEAIDHVRRARTNKTIGSVMLYTGSFFVGYGVGHVLSIKDFELYGEIVKQDRRRNTGWIIAGSGLGVALASIPMWNGYVKNIKKAVDLENDETETSVSQMRLNINGNGFGLAYQF